MISVAAIDRSEVVEPIEGAAESRRLVARRLDGRCEMIGAPTSEDVRNAGAKTLDGSALPRLPVDNPREVGAVTGR